MATFALTCVLAAGIFGRAIASWIVAGIETAEPMIHFVADSEDEAYYVLSRLFMISHADLENPGSRRIQLELGGHIFLERRRIAARSPWLSWILGILRRPFDVLKVVCEDKDTESWDLENLGSKTYMNDHRPLMKPVEITRSPATTTDGTDSISHERIAITRKSLPSQT